MREIIAHQRTAAVRETQVFSQRNSRREPEKCTPCLYGESRHPHLIRGSPALSDCSRWSALGTAPYTGPQSGPTPFCSSSTWTEESMEGQGLGSTLIQTLFYPLGSPGSRVRSQTRGGIPRFSKGRCYAILISSL